MHRLALVAVALAGCSPGGAGGADGSNVQEGGNALAARDAECRRVQEGGANFAGYENCMRYLPSERMAGVWVTGFERSGFVPGAREAPGFGDPAPNRIWLEFGSPARLDPALRAEIDKAGGTAAVAIEFVGRRTREPGGYGHLNAAEHQVIVDRIISARLLGPLRR